MNRNEAESLLRERWAFTSERWGEDVLDAWAGALRSDDAESAHQALRSLARGGASKISLGDIFRLMAGDAGRRVIDVETVELGEPGCTCGRDKDFTFVLCGMHRERGLHWTRAIRAGLTAGEPTKEIPRCTDESLPF